MRFCNGRVLWIVKCVIALLDCVWIFFVYKCIVIFKCIVEVILYIRNSEKILITRSQ